MSTATGRSANGQSELLPVRDGRRNVAELAALARSLYRSGPFVMRTMMHYRIYICPFERLITHVPPGSSVLDVGCGSGLFLALLASNVENLTAIGFDSSGPAIETAVQMKLAVEPWSGAKLQFVRLDAAEPWPTGPFDVVSLIDVVHHIPPLQQKGVFEQAIGRLKPGGVLLYKDMADWPFFHASMNRLHDLLVARQWIHYLPISRADEWARDAGLTLSHAESMTRFWYQHDLRVYRNA